MTNDLPNTARDAAGPVDGKAAHKSLDSRFASAHSVPGFDLCKNIRRHFS